MNNYGTSAEAVDDLLPATSAADHVFKEHEIIPQPSKSDAVISENKHSASE